MKNYYLSDEVMQNFLEEVGSIKNCYRDDGKPLTNPVFFSCGNGWFLLIKELIEDLLKLGWDGNLCQVKEKFGGLRFYIGSGSDEIHDKIINAEKESYNICEKCGNEGKLRNDIGWYLTLCEEHYNEKKESRKS